MSHQKNPTALKPADSPTADAIPAAPAADPAPDIGALLKRAEDEAAELKDAWLRARADVENVRKQGANDVARAHKYAIEKFAGELLAVKDALESTLAAKDAAPEALRDGVELTLKHPAAALAGARSILVERVAQDADLAATLRERLWTQGRMVSRVKKGKEAEGQKFDPHQHMAMTTVDSTEAPNTVVQVFQKGYRLQDRVLRPALVAVAKAPDDPE